MAIALPAQRPLEPAHRARSFLLLFGLWTAIGLSFATQFYLSSSLSGRSITWSEAVSHNLADWYVWAILSLVTLRLSHRYPIERLRWSDNVLIHLIASILVALAYAVLRAIVAQGQSWIIGQPIPFFEALRPLLFKTYHFNLIIYWVILSVAQAISYYRKYHERERTAIDLERRLSEARLQALQMQLNPHFLFNAMHSISALMHKDVEAADSMLARLSELLRLTLKNDGAQNIPLSAEIDMLEKYLDIERIRFGERLTVAFDIDPDTLNIPVPSLLLQPIVENALRHGIAPHARRGQLVITAKREGQCLRLSVRDNGGGLKTPVKEGIGISNTRIRLAEIFGDQQSFSIENNQDGDGVTVSLSLPATS